jgi:hypothetical protein
VRGLIRGLISERVNGETASQQLGPYVTYHSFASDLVPGDTNGFLDVFVRDRDTGSTVRITDGNSYSESPALSGDGRYVAFHSSATDQVPGDTNEAPDVFVWDRNAG